MTLNDSVLHEIAINNLNLLVKEDKNITTSLFACNGKELNIVDKDNFDSVYTLKEIEYPIYFTFNHFMTIITDNNEISYRKRKELLGILDDILTALCVLSDYHETELDNKSKDDREGSLPEIKQFNAVLNDISDRLDTVRERTIVTRCERMYLFFDELVEAFQTVSKHLYVTPFDVDDEEEEDKNSEEEDENSEEEEDENSEEQENNKEPESIFGGFWTQDTSKKAN